MSIYNNRQQYIKSINVNNNILRQKRKNPNIVKREKMRKCVKTNIIKEHNQEVKNKFEKLRRQLLRKYINFERKGNTTTGSRINYEK